MKLGKTRKNWHILSVEIQEEIIKKKITASDLIQAGVSKSAAYRALNGGLKNYNRTAECIRQFLGIDIWETEKSGNVELANLLNKQFGLVPDETQDQAQFIIEIAKLVEGYSIKKLS